MITKDSTSGLSELSLGTSTIKLAAFWRSLLIIDEVMLRPSIVKVAKRPSSINKQIRAVNRG